MTQTPQLPAGWMIGDGSEPTAQMFNGQWIIPKLGCDALATALQEREEQVKSAERNHWCEAMKKPKFRIRQDDEYLASLFNPIIEALKTKEKGQ